MSQAPTQIIIRIQSNKQTAQWFTLYYSGDNPQQDGKLLYKTSKKHLVGDQHLIEVYIPGPKP